MQNYKTSKEDIEEYLGNFGLDIEFLIQCQKCYS